MSGVWTVCRGVGKPGTEVEGKAAEVWLPYVIDTARIAVRVWSREQEQWVLDAAGYGVDPDVRFGDFDWTLSPKYDAGQPCPSSKPALPALERMATEVEPDNACTRL